MDGRHFDTITRGLTTGASRRAAFGGLLGGALALLTGASVLEAKKGGNGKGKGKGRGKGKKNKGKGNGNGHGKGHGKGRTKVTFCHRTGNDGFTLITVGSPAAKAHRKHDDVLCEVGVCQTGEATGCNDDGTCTFVLAGAGTECVAEGDLPGTCDAEGTCVPTDEPPVEE